MKINVAFLSTVVPLIVVAIGLIGWVVTLRADINVAQNQIVEIRSSITPLEAEAKQCAIEIHNLHKLIEDLDKIEAVTEEVDVLIFQIEELTKEVNSNSPNIEQLKRGLAIANDQMRTIMSDHDGFGDALKELGKAGLLPGGERRDYGGYAGGGGYGGGGYGGGGYGGY